MIERIIHFNVVCTDIDRSLEFYRDLLGGQVLGNPKQLATEMGIDTRPTGIAFQFDEPAIDWRACFIRFGTDDSGVTTVIDLLQWIRPVPVGKPLDRANHVGIPRVALRVDDIEKAYKEMKAKGVKFLSEPVVSDLKGLSHAKREELVKYHPELLRPIKYVVCLDPDGTLVELVESI